MGSSLDGMRVRVALDLSKKIDFGGCRFLVGGVPVTLSAMFRGTGCFEGCCSSLCGGVNAMDVCFKFLGMRSGVLVGGFDVSFLGTFPCRSINGSCSAFVNVKSSSASMFGFSTMSRGAAGLTLGGFDSFVTNSEVLSGGFGIAKRVACRVGWCNVVW